MKKITKIFGILTVATILITNTTAVGSPGDCCCKEGTPEENEPIVGVHPTIARLFEEQQAEIAQAQQRLADQIAAMYPRPQVAEEEESAQQGLADRIAAVSNYQTTEAEDSIRQEAEDSIRQEVADRIATFLEEESAQQGESNI